RDEAYKSVAESTARRDKARGGLFCHPIPVDFSRLLCRILRLSKERGLAPAPGPMRFGDCAAGQKRHTRGGIPERYVRGDARVPAALQKPARIQQPECLPPANFLTKTIFCLETTF